MGVMVRGKDKNKKGRVEGKDIWVGFSFKINFLKPKFSIFFLKKKKRSLCASEYNSLPMAVTALFDWAID